MDKNKKGFVFPDNILRTIDECSNGGFVLFTFNENGIPIVHYTFDNQASALALEKHIELWIDAINNLNSQFTLENIIKSASKKRRDGGKS